MLAGRPIAPEDAYDLPGTVHGLYKELVDNVDQSGVLFRDWRGFAAGTDADDVPVSYTHLAELGRGGKKQ